MWCPVCLKYPSSRLTKLLTCVSKSFPRVDGVIENVYEIPSSESSNGNSDSLYIYIYI